MDNIPSVDIHHFPCSILFMTSLFLCLFLLSGTNRNINFQIKVTLCLIFYDFSETRLSPDKPLTSIALHSNNLPAPRLLISCVDRWFTLVSWKQTRSVPWWWDLDVPFCFINTCHLLYPMREFRHWCLHLYFLYIPFSSFILFRVSTFIFLGQLYFEIQSLA